MLIYFHFKYKNANIMLNFDSLMIFRPLQKKTPKAVILSGLSHLLY